MTRRQVLALLQGGYDYEQAATRLGVSPGKAYLIATGLPADGGDTLTSEDRDRPGFLETSTQHLTNGAKAESPTVQEHVLTWVKQRAHADAQMLDAAATRTADPGEVDDPDDDHDILTVITRDHDQVTALLEQLATIPGHRKGGSRDQIARRESIVDMISVALSKHEATEQEYFWPVVRDTLPDGEARSAQALQQEQEGKDTLVALGRAEPDSDEFDDLVEQLHLRARKHVAFEDQVLLELRAAMSTADLERLGGKFRTAERAAPTRPHAHAPTEPAAAVKAVGAPTALVDRARDAVGSRPASRHGKAPGEAERKHEQAAAARRARHAKDPNAAPDQTNADDAGEEL